MSRHSNSPATQSNPARHLQEEQRQGNGYPGMGIQYPVEIAVVGVVVVGGVSLEALLLEKIAANQSGQFLRGQTVRGEPANRISIAIQLAQMLGNIHFRVFLSGDKQCSPAQIQVFFRAGHHAGELLAEATRTRSAALGIVHLTCCGCG